MSVAKETVLFRGDLYKMPTKFASPIQYALGNQLVNSWLDKYIEIRFTNVIHCISCGVRTPTSYGQGFCYSCFTNAPESSPCIINPELCQAHLGIGRDMEWERQHHLQPHIIYLALSSNLKVGITSQQQIPTRWIDQGASQAICFAVTPYRYLAGCIEVELKNHLSDKTNWQRMLKNEVNTSIDLIEESLRIKNLLSEELQQYCLPKEELKIYHLDFPHTHPITKIKSKDLQKDKIVSGILKGIKGQYFIFDDGQVINIRKHSGFEVEIVAIEKTEAEQLSLF